VLNGYSLPADATGEIRMNPWTCAFLISVAGAAGGVVNALITDNGFVFPQIRRTIWCPGIITNVLVGAFAAFASWAFYGSGAGIDLGAVSHDTQISLRFSALAGAFLVGVVGAKWITNEADKQLLKESVKVVATKNLTEEECEQLVKGSPRKVLDRVEAAG
jgi:hypothetical protein